jgi:hypothetical protein
MLRFYVIVLRFIFVKTSYHFSYRSELADQRYRFTSLLLLATYASIIASREVTVLIWQ